MKKDNIFLTLPKFSVVTDLPSSDCNIKNVLQSSLIEKIFVYPLGSESNNIGIANNKFISRMEIGDKTVIEYCETPEIAVEKSIENTKSNTISFFWTCAVFHRENALFFNNPDCFPFFYKEVMSLDEMQLCIHPKLTNKSFQKNNYPKGWSIASHGAPAPLVDSLPCKVIDANSNDDAAKQCFREQVELCITTESARKKYKLKTLHKFGSPEMVFFAGIPKQSAQIIANIHKTLYL